MSPRQSDERSLKDMRSLCFLCRCFYPLRGWYNSFTSCSRTQSEPSVDPMRQVLAAVPYCWSDKGPSAKSLIPRATLISWLVASCREKLGKIQSRPSSKKCDVEFTNDYIYIMSSRVRSSHEDYIRSHMDRTSYSVLSK